MNLLDAIKSFVIEKFWRPITDESVFYNPFNTAVYAAIFGLAAAYIGKPVMQRLELIPDKKFYIAIAPFVFLGGAARSLKDADILNTILLETPFIYFIMFAIVAGALYSSKKFEEELGIDYYKIMSVTGILLCLSTLVLFKYPDIGLLPPVLAIFGFATGVTYGAAYFLKRELTGFEFIVPVAAHWLDASTSYIALINGAAEKHILAQFFIDNFGPEGMFLLKLLVVVPAVYYIDQEIEGFDRKYYLFLIAVLGFALGVRNMVSTLAIT